MTTVMDIKFTAELFITVHNVFVFGRIVVHRKLRDAMAFQLVNSELLKTKYVKKYILNRISAMLSY